MSDNAAQEVCSLLTEIEPVDDLGAEHKTIALRWLAGTRDIYRRANPSTPSPHLVSYFLLVDRGAHRVLLCDHRLAGLWLPTGGHVEPGEHPADTVRREVVEELGIEGTIRCRDRPPAVLPDGHRNGRLGPCAPHRRQPVVCPRRAPGSGAAPRPA